MDYRKQINDLCDKCISEGEKLLQTQWSNTHMDQFIIADPETYVDLQLFSKWHSNCLVLMQLIGSSGKPWESTIVGEKANTLTNIMNIMGSLKSIKETIQLGLLVKAEELIYAEAFTNLIEQAEYLFEQKYLLASGVILRAVLEERLRFICIEKSISLHKDKPTLNDYNTELYKASIIDKLMYKRLDSLIAIGNEAAHNKPITEQNIKDLLSGTNEILLRLSGI